jgi:hypothetical protein
MFFMKTANVSERVNLQPRLGLRPHSEQETVGAFYKALPPCELINGDAARAACVYARASYPCRLSAPKQADNVVRSPKRNKMVVASQDDHATW